MEINKSKHKSGRPRVIPHQLESLVATLYRQGYGYRAISRILRDEYGVSSHFTTVKRVLKKLGILNHQNNNSVIISIKGADND